MKKVCIITGSRAEYGLLKPLIKKLKDSKSLELQIIATCTHLSPEFGLTYQEIENDGFKINEKIEILLSSDTSIGISKSMGLAMISFCEAFDRLKPNIIIIIGDRYEIFAAASAATVARIPIAHIHGGETTEGAFDESFRHSITKMSYLHFTSTEEYRKRVIQLGEDPQRVFNVGAIGIENIKTIDLLEKDKLQETLGYQFGEKTILVTFHPTTLENNTAENQFKNLLDAIEEFETIKVIFTKSNADIGGKIINNMIDEYVKRNNQKSVAYTSLGSVKYLSVMKYCDVVVGNSSSGIIEAPAFMIPTINIGDRQKGRVQAKSVINCEPIKNDIITSLNKAFSEEFKKALKDTKNPYGDGNVTDRIITQIESYLLNDKIQLKKAFYNIDIDN